MPNWLHRTTAALCYAGALRVPVVALVLPEWAFTIPSGLLIAGLAWWYGKRHSPFLLHHAREGFRWSLQANLLLAGLALFSMLCHFIWIRWDTHGAYLLWNLMATVVQWAGVLISILTLLVMAGALRGHTGDPFEIGRRAPGD